jgi:nicotinate-nucleotide--dimethylbenzimidazole phosphoribosyltransferase
MLGTFAAGGAAVCVLGRQAGARLVVADLGVLSPPAPAEGAAEVLDLRVRAGTANSAVEPAMSAAEAYRAVRRGIDLAAGLVADGVDLVALGEMGIGNTTTASAVTARLLGVPAASVVGPGTGLDDDGVALKTRVVERVLARHPEARDPLDVLAAMGGLEVAALTGVVLGCAARRVPVVLDGFITTAAALVAARLAPACTDAMVAGHRSREPGHAVQLGALGLDPVLDLDLRLGEGSGATLAVGVVRAAAAVLDEMATFASLGLAEE